jgi:hypothetical protein
MTRNEFDNLPTKRTFSQNDVGKIFGMPDYAPFTDKPVVFVGKPDDFTQVAYELNIVEFI